ncbi:MAG: transglutaminase family protein [Planctomycetota bacterium]
MQTERTRRSNIEAAIRLLTDDDPRVVRRVEGCLVAWGRPARIVLAEMCRDADPQVRTRARRLLDRIDLQLLADEVAAMARPRGGRFQLEYALDALHRFSRTEDFEPGAFDRQLEAFVAPLREVVEGRTSRTQARHLVGQLGHEAGFEVLDHPFEREALLPSRVLSSRVGSAAAICALYLAIGRRAGLECSPVRLGDYFLVRVHGDRRVLVDPRHGGRTVTKADCLRYLRERGDREAGLHRIADVPDAEVFAGLLDDLIAATSGRSAHALRRALVRVRSRVAADEVFMPLKPVPPN